MIDGRGQVRLTDFGLATAIGPIEDVRAGTPAYQAPEQLAGREVTARSDLFALGLVLYEMFTGQRAFPATTPAELRRLYSEGTPSKPSAHVSNLDPAVERVILRCLAREPADRPRSAYEVLAATPRRRSAGRRPGRRPDAVPGSRRQRPDRRYPTTPRRRGLAAGDLARHLRRRPPERPVQAVLPGPAAEGPARGAGRQGP